MKDMPPHGVMMPPLIERPSGFGFADIQWRDDMIRSLREALKFYADERNYQRCMWYGELGPSLLDGDNGKIARAALEGK